MGIETNKVWQLKADGRVVTYSIELTKLNAEPEVSIAEYLHGTG